ncbi:hypothetical protein DIPPA_05502 [Diplonema papillatum]|nr:hypothetical protein DIPPA_05502 [Diplonema papillatum]
MHSRFAGEDHTPASSLRDRGRSARQTAMYNAVPPSAVRYVPQTPAVPEWWDDITPPQVPGAAPAPAYRFTSMDSAEGPPGSLPRLASYDTARPPSVSSHPAHADAYRFYHPTEEQLSWGNIERHRKPEATLQTRLGNVVSHGLTRLGALLKLFVLALLLVCVFLCVGYARRALAGGLPCWLSRRAFADEKIAKEMEKYGVSACEFDADVAATELLAVQLLAARSAEAPPTGLLRRRSTLAGVIDKEKLEEILDHELYPEPGLSVPRSRFWMVLEEALRASPYLISPPSGNTIALDPPATLFSFSTLMYRPQTCLALLSRLFWDTLFASATYLSLPLCLVALLAWHLRSRRRMMQAADTLITTAYSELRSHNRPLPMLDLRRQCVSALKGKMEPALIEKLWPSPGDPDGPVEAALREDDIGVAIFKASKDDPNIYIMLRASEHGPEQW